MDTEANPTAAQAASDLERAPRLDFPVVALGASAGGLEAFSEFLADVPADSGMAYVCIQHLPPDRESLLVDILGRRTALPVQLIEDGLAIEPNRVYVIRPGRTLTMPQGRFRLTEPRQPPGRRHPIDDFFGSLAEEQRERAIAVVLSGMGSNGTAGAHSIRAVGGVCLAQDPASARFPVMPQSLIDAGLADLVLRPAAMPAALHRYGEQRYLREVFAEPADPRETDLLGEILLQLRAGGRHDFTRYKKPTLRRRVLRRMGLRQVAAMGDYRKLLERDPAEAAALGEDLLIHITAFFRDPEAWEALRAKVIAPLVADRADGGCVRAWVAACASGEEAYSLGMLLLEEAAAARKHFELKIFATDLAGRPLADGRAGAYPAAIEADVSPERLARFFQKEENGYRVKGELRDAVVFAPQNLLQDPPFSRLDICTCRNLLIYLEPESQKRALRLLHFALREGGTLFLGSSETLGVVEELFEPVDRKFRIFRRLPGSHREPIDFPPARRGVQVQEGAAEHEWSLPRTSIMNLTQQALLARHGPPALVIDRAQRIVFFQGATDRVLDQPQGEPTVDLLALARESLRTPLRRTVQEALARDQPAQSGVFEADLADGRFQLEIRAAPLDSRPQPAYFLVSFEEQRELPPLAVFANSSPADGRAELERELLRIRSELQGKIEELQANNEELKASHEETISINEELQSSNEELETSKEELQSLNEELTTVNSQLQAKMEELEAATNDLSSLLSSTAIAVIFLDAQFRIRRFTPAVKDLLELISSDVGRPLSDLALKFTDSRLLADAREVLEKLTPLRQEVTSASGRTYIRSIQPYRTTDHRIDGVVLTFVDITERKVAEAALRRSEEQHRLMLENLKEYAIFMLDADGRIVSWPKPAERMLGYARDEALGRELAIVLPAEEGSAELARRELEEARTRGSIVHEGWRVRKDGSRFWGTGALSAVHDDDDGRLRGFVKVLRDNTDRKLAEEDLRAAKQKAEAANEAKDQFLATVSHELRTPLSSIVLWANLIDEKAPIDPKQLADVLTAIKRGAAEQRELIEDLVDTARIATGKLQLQVGPVDLGRLAQSAATSFSIPAQEKELQLQTDFAASLGIVSADPVRLKQVMNNLLSNAIKFTPPGGRIQFFAGRDGDEVVIRVTDSGQGFPPEFGSRLFTRFEQAEQSGTRAQGGLGIGLSIARQIVALHGGIISGNSAGSGRGAVFTVRLPLPALAPGAVPPPPPPVTGGIAEVLKGRRLLLLEDDAETRKALLAVLRGAGATVRPVSTALAGLVEFQRQRPDLIISDLGLPEIDGFEFIREIRKIEKREAAASTPALALTAFAGEQDSRRALESGFHRCLNKPVEPVRLVAALAELGPPA